MTSTTEHKENAMKSYWKYILYILTISSICLITFHALIPSDKESYSPNSASVCWEDSDPNVKGIDLGQTDHTTDKELNILAVGDWGIIDHNAENKETFDESVQRNLANALKHYVSDNTAHFILSMGDHFYPHGVTSTKDSRWNTTFEHVFNSQQLNALRWYAVLGNHDFPNQNAQILYTNDQSALNRWCLPSHYYTFSHQFQHFSAKFIAIDSIILCRKDADSQNLLFWLEEALRKNEDDIIIVFGHYPLAVKSSHFHCDCNDRDTECDLSQFADLLNEYDVSVYISGHSHSSEIFVGNDKMLHIVTGAFGRINTKKCNNLYDYSANVYQWKTIFNSLIPSFSVIKMDQNKVSVQMRDIHNNIIAQHTIKWNKQSNTTTKYTLPAIVIIALCIGIAAFYFIRPRNAESKQKCKSHDYILII